MKLRLKGNEGNSLRLRVSRSELERLQRGEAVLEIVRLGPSEAHTFSYTLVRSNDASAVVVLAAEGSITVSVPEARMGVWSREGEVGIYETIAFSGGHQLELILEKDFACLDREDADNSDTFEHPHAGASC